MTEDLDLIWGAADIAQALNLKNVRRAVYLLETGRLPSAKKVGRLWVISRQALRLQFGTTEVSAEAHAE